MANTTNATGPIDHDELLDFHEALAADVTGVALDDELGIRIDGALADQVNADDDEDTELSPEEIFYALPRYNTRGMFHRSQAA